MVSPIVRPTDTPVDPNLVPAPEALRTAGHVDALLPNSSANESTGPSPPGAIDAPQALPSKEAIKVALAWSKQNVLSLDGGGIRGYWALLVLAKLMYHIAIIEAEYASAEQRSDGHGLHSFWPQEEPQNVTQVQSRPQGWRYLPCHYFDYIVGSSTGGLIAIMLGRLRMTVQDCLAEYQSIGQQIFGSPRWYSQHRFPFFNKITKYSAKNAQKAFDDVVSRRCEDHSTNGWATEPKFPSENGVCRTFVTTRIKYLNDPDKKGINRLLLLRSYDCDTHEAITQGQDVHHANGFKRANTNATTMSRMSATTKYPKDTAYKIILTSAADMRISHVARAATAAPSYFRPLKHKIGEHEVELTDGGFGHTNNPIGLALKEIVQLHGKTQIGLAVSVGTARPAEKERSSTLGLLLWGMGEATNPRPAEDSAETRAHDIGFDLVRFNAEDDADDETVIGATDVKMDDWSPRRAKGKVASGSKTLDKMQNHFNKWYSDERNSERIRAYARKLVDVRRLRILDENQWERFSVLSSFRCTQSTEGGQKRCLRDGFTHRGSFIDHLRSHHKWTQATIDQRRDMIENQMRRWVYKGGSA